MTTLSKINLLIAQLFPTGRAFKIPKGGFFAKLKEGLAVTMNRAYSDARSIYDSILPDNPNFGPSDATRWEGKLGLITNSAVPIEDRRAAIQRKWNHPGGIPARQSYLFLQRELDLAGFNVTVYENRFDDGMGGYITKDPITVSGGVNTINQLGDNQLGDAQLGSGYTNIVANHINEDKDAIFDVGSNLRFTFFIGGSPIGTTANVDVERKDEFRELILRVKPRHTVAYLFINYV